MPAQAVPGNPASLTCQGKGVDRSAEARYRGEIFVNAPLHTVWRLQSEVENWISWQKPAAPMTVERLDHGPLRRHSRFRATVPTPPGPVVITSAVQQLQYGRCTRWTGPADGPGYHIHGVHVWNYVKVPGGVLVGTEESRRRALMPPGAPAAGVTAGSGGGGAGGSKPRRDNRAGPPPVPAR